jgi:hypothetical protein
MAEHSAPFRYWKCWQSTFVTGQAVQPETTLALFTREPKFNVSQNILSRSLQTPLPVPTVVSSVRGVAQSVDSYSLISLRMKGGGGEIHHDSTTLVINLVLFVGDILLLIVGAYCSSLFLLSFLNITLRNRFTEPFGKRFDLGCQQFYCLLIPLRTLRHQ